MKLTFPCFMIQKGTPRKEPLRSFVKRDHRRPAAPAGFDSFSFSELNIGRARILQVSFPCRLQIYDTCQVRWDWQCKWGRHEHLETILSSSSSPSGFQTSCNWNLCNAQWCILVWTSSNHHDCPVGLWLWTIWARLGLVAARTKTEVRVFTFFKNHFRLHCVVTFFRYGEALVRLRRGLRNGENVGGGEERASALTASPRDSGSTVVEEI